MARKRILICPDDPYHITARCLNREWFDLPMETVWSIMEDYLFLIHQLFSPRIHSFLLMQNHFHLVLTAPENNLRELLLYFMRETSKEITRLSGRINQTWGARNYKTHLARYHYFMNTYKYVYQNPVRAGVCKWVEEYPYSTLHGLCGFRKAIIPLEDTILFCPEFDESTLSWLNRRPAVELEDEMRLALRRSEFQLPDMRKTGLPSVLERILL